MKQSSLLLGAAVLMLATACSNDEVVSVAPQSGAIGFSSFIDKATRGVDNTTENLTSFDVFGVMSNGTESVVAFDGEKVSRTAPATDWSYSHTRYWTAGFNYTFAGVAPAGAAEVNNGNGDTMGGVTNLTFTNSDGSVDLLFGYADVPLQKDGADNSDWGQTVDITFGHILSRVLFKFKNAMPEGYSIKVTNVTLTGANNKATYTVADEAWREAEGSNNTTKYAYALAEGKDQVVSGGTAETQPSYLIPTLANVAEENLECYNVTFTVKLLLADAREDVDTLVEVGTYNLEGTLGTYNLEGTLSALTYEAGMSYCFTTTIDEDNITGDNNDPLTKNKIKFTASVTSWPDKDNDIDKDFTFSKKD